MARKTIDLRGKVVAITGGARGIGLSTATRLTRLGATVAIGDIDEPRVKAAGEDLGLTVHSRLDVTDPRSFEEFLDRVERELGPLDVLVNNAGIMPVGQLTDEPDEVTRRILDINVFGVIVGSRLAARRMAPRRRGHVINIASLAGETFLPGLATYSGSKAAVVGFTESARRELRRSGVCFSAVLPTFTDTELSAGTPGTRGMRNAAPEDIAEAIAALITKPRPEVRVTRAAGLMSASQRYLPRRVNDAVFRLGGMYEAFTSKVDTEHRRAYEERARATR
ncbi:SDR family oxidoreductase [Amycolatopsis sp. NPDC006125]|uniref:SDR family oxidoreductase n=1 Tax=Amycolatopsis sp. NPDC006125 TaxID=3156730 RepID=UPI0033B052CA